ncbi:MAG: chemotaxis protein CheA [Bacilli bacterium]|nr:chemotaxis protein CheA [Bacilli bacterium]
MVESHNSAYLGVFLDEMDEQLQYLDDALLSLESNGAKDDTIEKIFRAAHTLKGSSAAMGFERLKELTHQMESVFDLLRNGHLQATSELFNIIFDCVDYIKQLRQSILGGVMLENDTQSLLQRLEEVRIYADGYSSASKDTSPENVAHKNASALIMAFNEEQKQRIQDALASGYNAWAIYIRLSMAEHMKYVRATLVHNKLKEQGEIVCFSPELELSEKEESLYENINCALITKAKHEEVIQTINQISQIDTFDIQSITLQNLAAFDEESTIDVIDHVPSDETEIKRSVEMETKAHAQVSHTVRVDVERLEGLLNLVGELIIDNTRLRDVRNKLNEQFKNNGNIVLMNDIANHLDRVIGDLQDGMMKTRMLPIEHLFGRFPRLIRDLAQKANKEIELIIEGKDTELDRTLIEELSDPLIHILRNSADHGLENPEERERLGKSRKGVILLKASHQGNMIVITIADDGRGIDTDKVKEMTLRKGYATEEEIARMTEKELIFLIFRSGFSTANQVTDLSGRGVGMDIVKSHIEKINGVIDIETTRNEGTVFTIKLPLTLAIIQSLLIKLGTTTFAIPLVNVIEIFRLQAADVRLIQGKEVCMFREKVLPLVRLHSKLNVQQDIEQKKDRLFVVIAGFADKRVCLVVDQTIGNQEIVIKPLGKYVGNVPYIAGSTILGDGHVAHILDVGAIAREAGASYENKLLDYREEAQLEARNKKYVTFQLADTIFGLHINKVKEIIPVPVIHSLVSVSAYVLGMINLRGILLPVYDLRHSLGMAPTSTSSKSRIIVCEVLGHEVGLMVDKVSEVTRFSDTEFEDSPNHVLRQADFVDGIYKKDQQFIILLNLEAIVRLESENLLYAH